MIQPYFANDRVTLYHGDCIDVFNGMEPDSIDLTFGSPLYCDARTYGIGAQRDCLEWIEWMLNVTEAAARVTKGPVVWVAAGVTRERNYWPACEGLMYEWWKRGGTHQLYRPCFWHRVGIPGSGGKDWFRADVEYVMCFKKPGILPWSDNTAMGHVPKWAPGGEMSNRMANGARVNQWGHSIESGATVTEANGSIRSKGKRPSHRDQWGGTGNETSGDGRNANGTRKTRTGRKILTVPRGGNGKVAADGQHANEQDYAEPVLANPGVNIEANYTAADVAKILAEYKSGNWLHTNVGGGVMGHKMAHENEAPFPTKLAEFFVRSLCPPGGTVCDPFSGSGTTMQTCIETGRRGMGIDIRESQCELARRRIASVQPCLFD